MDKKTKLTLLIVGIAEAVILVFCLVVAIIVLTCPTAANGGLDASGKSAFIQYLVANPVVFFCAICLPCFIILVVDGVYLIIYATKRQSNVSDAERKAIEEEAKRQVMEELKKGTPSQSDEMKEESKDPAKKS